ncbi:MAG: hypothetical protein AMXMBFR74_08790 [Parvibaculum sp.]
MSPVPLIAAIAIYSYLNKRDETVKGQGVLWVAGARSGHMNRYGTVTNRHGGFRAFFGAARRLSSECHRTVTKGGVIPAPVHAEALIPALREAARMAAEGPPGS